ncbi:hypothetical protein FisN_1Lh646 [Fistulifera solaris]|uniref:IMP-specific 5'-nucleotidase 1 n=1 Tax=Fistulifera solaris TaxID=1519565 RepID=A0A1Z5K0V8_FISSO|nr:hypothetical protein FisN_1Lh646 [Fistulifera solaris]|eukprot:GAX19887.1 hypothetical protein FisN_1Lh646 [Fistulifera solaris]
MLQHSFVLDSLETTGADTFEHFETLIDEHRERQDSPQPSRLQQLVPTIGTFHTPLPLRDAFEAYNDKHKLTKRKHIQISFNELRHILNLAQIMAFSDRRKILRAFSDIQDDESSGSSEKRSQDGQNDTKVAKNAPIGTFHGPQLISFDGDQTLYSDGANFESNPKLAHQLYTLLRHGVAVAIVTAAGYEYNVEKYEYRISGLLRYFENKQLTPEECSRFYLFGGECNYLLRLGPDYRLVPVPEQGPNGWLTATQSLKDSPANWSEQDISNLLDSAFATVEYTISELNLKARAIRKKRSVGLVPLEPGKQTEISRESLDETVLRSHEALRKMRNGEGPGLPYCAFNGGTDAWVDVGNKRVGVQILQSYLGITPERSLHIGDQFLNTGNDYAARDVSPCIWIINPQETTYILKTILRLAGIAPHDKLEGHDDGTGAMTKRPSHIDFDEMERRSQAVQKMDVYTGKMVTMT